MIRLGHMRWHARATKTVLCVLMIIVLSLVFTINSGTGFLTQKAAMIKSYPSVPADVESNPGAIRIMIVGDSISQGVEGDWTWRYRLWEWLKSQDIVIDYVGPFMGTRPQAVPSTVGNVIKPEPLGLPPTGGAITTGGYASGLDPSFNSRHFSASGRTLWEDVEFISAMMEKYNPEYLLVLLGFNDLAWHNPATDDQDVLANMEEFVKRARAIKPTVKFAIGNVPQRIPKFGELPARTDDYNKRLADAIPKWSTKISPIELVHVQEGYSCGGNGCLAGFDGLHPNTLGDYQIAHAFSRALNKGFGLGNGEFTIPSPVDLPVRPISIPRNLRAVSGVTGINVTWDTIYGARGYDIQSRPLGEQNWTLSLNLQESYFHTAWIKAKFVEMEYKVRMSNGDQEKGEWSRTIGTCRPWSDLKHDERWDWRWCYRRVWGC